MRVPGQLLRGMTVVSLEQAVAAPYCTAKLADQGARVIKVERAGEGDFARKYDANARGASSYFAWLNRGKESLNLNIKRPQDRDLLLGMVQEKSVDVFVQNLKPGAAARAGLGSETLRSLNDQLITIDVSGYGESGPRSSYKAYDLLVAAEAGLCSVTGGPDGPGRVGVSVCDITCGQNAYSAVLQGLLERASTGKGSGYSISLFDSVAEIMAVPFVQAKYTGSEPPRLGLSHPSIAPYGCYQTKDGRHILISVQSEREWGILCAKVICDENLAKDERFNVATKRVTNRCALDERIQACFGSQDANTLTEKLLEVGIAFGELNTVTGLVDHPQLSTVSYKTELGDSIDVPAPAVKPFATNLGNVPKAGEHTKAILDEFAHLRKAHVISS